MSKTVIIKHKSEADKDSAYMDVKNASMKGDYLHVYYEDGDEDIVPVYHNVSKICIRNSS
jgi:hypothetical protein